MIELLRLSIFLILTLIIYQDFKSRLINVWCLVLLALALTALTVISLSVFDTLINFIFSVLYFSFLFLTIKIYYYIKLKLWQPIIDNVIGLGDVILILIIGTALFPQNQIYFFTAVFVAALPIQLILFNKNKSAPLAAYICMAYMFNLIASHFSNVKL